MKLSGLNPAKAMKYLEKISGGLMIMDKPKQCVTNSRWKNGINDCGRRPLRRGSVDSSLTGTYHVNIHLKEKTFSSDKRVNETKKSPSYVMGKKDKDTKVESSPNSKTLCSSTNKTCGSCDKISLSKTISCHSELRPILKSGRSSSSLDRESPSSLKEKQTTETKFSYRLPVVPRPTIRKSVSFREDLLEDVCSRRRFSSSSLNFPLETTGNN